MNDNRSGSGPDDDEPGTWATETLPLDIRKAMLERELKRLGLNKGPTAQQQPRDGSSRPSGGKDPEHGD